MDKNMENNFSPYMNFDIGADPLLGENPMFNPIMQYEQAYMYYRYLSQQMDYKIKCKEYEKMCNSQNTSSNERHERKIE